MPIPATWRAVTDEEQREAIAQAEAMPAPPGCVDRFWWLGGVRVFGYEGSFLRPGDNMVNQVFVMGSLNVPSSQDDTQ